MKYILKLIICLTAICGATLPVAALDRDASNIFDVYLKPQTLVRLPDGRKYHLFCNGSGSPTAILDAGWGGWSTDWHKIQPELGRITRVCAVDRAGYGFSDPGPLPRDVLAEANDLEAALGSVGFAPPFVMVGHSAGGMVLREYAFLYPKKVAAMLLIDPGFEHARKRLGFSQEQIADAGRFWVKCSERASVSPLKLGEILPGESRACVGEPGADWSKSMAEKMVVERGKPSLLQAMVSEDENFDGRTSDELDKSRRHLEMPVVVLSQDEAIFIQGSPDLGVAKARYATWRQAHEEIARESSQGVHKVVEGAGHYVFVDKKDVVVEEFRQIIDAVRHVSP